MEQLKHECGVALIYLRKPLSYYHEKHGSWQYGLKKLYLLMEKQHNRGQEAAGIGVINIASSPGDEYILRERALGSSAIHEIFDKVGSIAKPLIKEKRTPKWIEENSALGGQMLMGHLRYSTTGRSGNKYIHPFLRRSNWRSRNLMVCGNFNMTNVPELFSYMVAEGQHPRQNADTYLVLETLGNALDKQIQKLYDKFADNALGHDLNDLIRENTELAPILKSASAKWDGGYIICGMTGDGAAFAMRDPWGIRSACYYIDDEVVVVASERPVIQTALNVEHTDVHELLPGEALIINGRGGVELASIRPPAGKITPCSFERIYFSRGSDKEIYLERKTLGRQLVPSILNAMGGDLENTVFSFIPNTAEVAYLGMMEGLEEHLRGLKSDLISKANSLSEVENILSMRVRTEKVAVKDIKLRTFISEDSQRHDLAAHVYDITYGSIIPDKDNLVVIDDSIVRGTTLKTSILKILDRLSPKKIVVVSSCPQVRYPDCYGIDMSSLTEFVAFHAAIALLKERGGDGYIEEIYKKCKAQEGLPKEQITNFVKDVYEPFKAHEITKKITQLLTPPCVKAEVEVVFQSIEGLHAACPRNAGDWYFTGNYPTAGGRMFVNQAFINFYEGKRGR